MLIRFRHSAYTAFDAKPESEPQKFALIVTYLPSIADEPGNLSKPDILLFKFDVGGHHLPMSVETG
jgi:hypothetical protein